jgi:hypothetical protein
LGAAALLSRISGFGRTITPAQVRESVQAGMRRHGTNQTTTPSGTPTGTRRNRKNRGQTQTQHA